MTSPDWSLALRILHVVLLSLTLYSLPVLAADKQQISAYTEIDLHTGIQSKLFIGSKQLLEASHTSYILKSAPWIRALRQAKLEPMAFIFPIYRMPNREKYFHWFCPIAPARNIYLFRLTNQLNSHIKTLADAKDYKIGIITNSMIEHFLTQRQFIKGKHLDSTVYDEVNFVKFINKRIDLIAQSQERMHELLVMYNMDASMVTKEYLLFDQFQYSLCAAANINMPPKMLAKLDRAYETIISSEILKQPLLKTIFPLCQH